MSFKSFKYLKISSNYGINDMQFVTQYIKLIKLVMFLFYYVQRKQLPHLFNITSHSLSILSGYVCFFLPISAFNEALSRMQFLTITDRSVTGFLVNRCNHLFSHSTQEYFNYITMASNDHLNVARTWLYQLHITWP